jgi:hypothetical protein
MEGSCRGRLSQTGEGIGMCLGISLQGIRQSEEVSHAFRA